MARRILDVGVHHNPREEVRMASVEKHGGQAILPVASRQAGLPVPHTPFPSGTTIGRYRLSALLGSGAMGDVYRAHDRVLEREVALKVLPPELVNDRERVRRFAQEARAASALSHPHIVTTYEIGHARPAMNVQTIHERRAGEVHYIAMEYVEGRTLRDALTAGLPQRRAVELLAQVADGLGKAHAAGIIHRDLKPENVIVANDGYAKIVDFGLAKLVDLERGWNPIGADSPTLRALTQQGEVLGTPGYMAPEQITGRAVDPRADVFSFGCILYEVVARRRPFEAESFVDTLYKILHEQPQPVDDPELQRILAKCLAKDREERYQSIRDAALDLRQWLEPGASAPRKRRVWPAVIAVAALVVVGQAILPVIVSHRQAGLPVLHAARITTNGRATQVALSPDSRYIAYTTSDARGNALWIEQVETKAALQLVAPTSGHFAGVTFSRDGNYVYYVRYDDGMYAYLNRIPILGGSAEVILRDIDTAPSFAPDGRALAFVRDDYNQSTSTLYVARSDGSGERVLATFRLPDRALSPAWSPDGTRIVVAQRGKLVDIHYPAGTLHEIPAKRFESLKGVVWSPDGKALIAAGATDDAGDRVRLWRVDPKSGDATALTDELSDVVLPSVSSDGSIAALQIVRQASLFGLDESGVHPLTSGAGSANGMGGLAWAGDRVVYSSQAERTSSLWSVDPRTGDAQRLTGENVSAVRPLATPDGATIVFAATSHGQSTLWSMRRDGSARRQLTRGPRDYDFAIAPDGKSIAWASIDPSTNAWSLLTMPLGGGKATRLIADRATLIEQLHYTPDGRFIVFTGYAGSMLRLYRVPASGGAVREVTARRSMDSAISGDGSTIACSYAFEDMNDAPLALMAPDGSNLRVLPIRGSMYRWCNDDVTFLRSEHGTTNLWRLDGTTPKRLTDFTEGSIADYAWSADGKRAAITHVVDSADVVVIRR
jgi:eukaryotic-like serine/threonine-protein kinase